MMHIMKKPEYEVLLFYKYTHIADPQQLMEQQRMLCNKLQLTGRIIIAEEGINATLEGTKDKTKQYQNILLADPRFSETDIKCSEGTGEAFPKLSIKVRDEIVSAHLGASDINPYVVTGKYLTADELHEWFEQGREFYIVDMRNDYEQKSGYFENSMLSQFGNFRDLPSILPKLKNLKHKTVVTVCTGGVRCEKASGFLVNNGFTDVYQLYGGIVTYMEKFPNRHYKGKLYVFDNRILMGFNAQDPSYEMVGRCDLCGELSEMYVNCAYDPCHEHFIACEDCMLSTGKVYCSKPCQMQATNN